MPKFYVRSGSLQLVIDADHARAAAIWGVHRCLAQVTPFGDEENVAGRSYEATVPQRQLGETISVSECGFGGEDTQEMATLPVVAEWSRLLVALDRLHGQLSDKPTSL